MTSGADIKGIKVEWSGSVVSVQPRIRLTRSFDQRSHTYQGYLLSIDGRVDGEVRKFSVGIGKSAQSKQGFRAGDQISGEALPVVDSRLEAAEYYKASKLRLLARADDAGTSPPPWLGPPPDLEMYRKRGHRRLDTRTYSGKCQCCYWGCRMPVEMIIDHWNPSQKRYRFETFCYGPKSCSLYKPGQPRKVPGRKGMVWVEEDWVDEDATSHRDEDE